MINDNHPVWDLYNEYRTARLNKLYYEKQLTVLKRWNTGIEIVLAITASSGIAGLWLWETLSGGIIWEVILAIADLLAIIKPIIKLDNRIQRKGELLSHWKLHENDLNTLCLLVKQHNSYDNDIQCKFIVLMGAKSAIIKKELNEEPDKNLQNICYDQENEELPVDYFFIPEG